VGVIAEEVAAVLPEVVAFEDDGQARGVNYGKLVSVLIEATKAQQEDLATKEQTIEQQQEEIDTLKDRVTRLEKLVQQQLSATKKTDEASYDASDESAASSSYR
jgi:septal ring factor EnvC (AmiA/AmiB activator)